MLVSLVGIKHSGKSTIGKLLAKELSCNFIDTDYQIEKSEGKSVREIFKTQGKDFFMKLEAKACLDIINSTNLKNRNLIISTGGGFCDNKEAVCILKEHTTLVFLDVSFDTILKRIEENSKQRGSFPPYLDSNNPKESFKPIYEQRRNFYKKIATITIFEKTDSGDSSFKTQNAIVKEIIQKIAF